MSLLAETAALLDDTARRRRLYQCSFPGRRSTPPTGPRRCRGSASRYLGILADDEATLG